MVPSGSQELLDVENRIRSVSCEALGALPLVLDELLPQEAPINDVIADVPVEVLEVLSLEQAKDRRPTRLARVALLAGLREAAQQLRNAAICASLPGPGVDLNALRRRLRNRLLFGPDG